MSVWLVAGALGAVVAAVFVHALRGGGTGRRPDDAARVAVWRSRVRELDAERAAGTLDDARYAEAMRELEDAAAMELVETDAVAAARAGWPTALGAALGVPAVALSLYAVLGTPTPPPVETDLESLVVELDARLAATPDDLQGQMLLGRSRVVLGDYDGAVRAWREAQRLAPDDPTVLANLGEAMILAEPATLTDEPALLVEAALAGDPDNPKALWYGGLAAEARGEREVAAERWRALLAQDPPDALREVLERRIAAAEAAPFELTVTVSVAAGLPATPDGATLFVTAHTPDGGPPLAALRLPVSTWPLEVTLTERDAMIAGVDLPANGELVIVARISASGDAARTSGDLVGDARWRGGAAAAVVIDEVVE